MSLRRAICVVCETLSLLSELSEGFRGVPDPFVWIPTDSGFVSVGKFLVSRV